MKRHTMCGKIRKRAKDISLPPTSASKFMLKKIYFDVIIRFFNIILSMNPKKSI